jgi:GNAT superfamily N-acetyltransferase
VTPASLYGFSRLRAFHETQGFDSGSTQIDNYIRHYALVNQEANIAQTWILQPKGRLIVVGYYTLVTAEIARSDVAPVIPESFPGYPIPCVRIAKLGVDIKYQRQGLGGLLVAHALRECKQVSLSAGCYAVVVDAIDAGVVGFYTRCGFIPIPNNPLMLLYPTASI